jgi:hypothetical protein
MRVFKLFDCRVLHRSLTLSNRACLLELIVAFDWPRCVKICVSGRTKLLKAEILAAFDDLGESTLLLDVVANVSMTSNGAYVFSFKLKVRVSLQRLGEVFPNTALHDLVVNLGLASVGRVEKNSRCLVDGLEVLANLNHSLGFKFRRRRSLLDRRQVQVWKVWDIFVIGCHFLAQVLVETLFILPRLNLLRCSRTKGLLNNYNSIVNLVVSVQFSIQVSNVEAS